MRVAIAGCAGRLGRLLVAEASASGHVLVAGTVSPHSLQVGQDIGTLAGLEPLGVAAVGEPAKLFDGAEVVIDFTNPVSTRRHAELAVIKKIPLVIGTTGLDAATEQVINTAAKTIPVLYAANFSRGVALLLELAALAARALPDADLGIYELHHNKKVDAPSGTALALGAATGRKPQYASLRGGTVVGDHTLILALDGERIELTHKAENRAIYAKGALAAAKWLIGQKPGRYTLKDLLAS
jgi:4-hydroxy-tetrahydrodipicolinate reductase